MQELFGPLSGASASMMLRVRWHDISLLMACRLPTVSHCMSGSLVVQHQDTVWQFSRTWTRLGCQVKNPCLDGGAPKRIPHQPGRASRSRSPHRHLVDIDEAIGDEEVVIITVHSCEAPQEHHTIRFPLQTLVARVHDVLAARLECQARDVVIHFHRAAGSRAAATRWRGRDRELAAYFLAGSSGGRWCSASRTSLSCLRPSRPVVSYVTLRMRCPRMIDEQEVITAWIAGSLNVSTWTILVEEATEEVQRHYGIQGLQFVFCMPVYDALVGGGCLAAIAERSGKGLVDSHSPLFGKSHHVQLTSLP